MCSTSPKNGCRFGEKCSYAHRQVDERPSKRSKKNGDKSAVAKLKITRQLGCVCQDMEPEVFIDFAEEFRHAETNLMCSILKPCYVMLTFETRIHRLEWFTQVILISVTPMLQNLRIGLKKRRNGKGATFLEVYKRFFLGYNVPRRWCLFWDTKNFFWDTEVFFRDTKFFGWIQRLFSGYKGLFFSGYKETVTKIQKTSQKLQKYKNNFQKQTKKEE